MENNTIESLVGGNTEGRKETKVAALLMMIRRYLDRLNGVHTTLISFKYLLN